MRKLPKKFNKKGQVLDNLGNLAAGIAALTIILTVAFVVMSEGKAQANDLAPTETSINQTFAITADTFFSLTNNCITEQNVNILEVYNSTVKPSTLLNSANYTVVLNGLNISNDRLGNFGLLGSNVNVSYSCTTKSNAYNATSTLQNATSTVPGWVPLIIIAVIGALMLALVERFRNQ